LKFSDPLRSSNVRSGPLRSSQDLSGPLRSSQVLSDSLRSSQVLSGSLRSSKNTEIFTIIEIYFFQVRYKLAPIIWKRLYNIERARYTGGAGALNLLLGRGSMLPWPSSLTMIVLIATVASVHTVMLSNYLISGQMSLGTSGVR
jgi:hypothetical protein